MKSRRLTTLFIIGLLLFGVLIKCYYIHYTDTWERQHDVISFGADEGHAAYIEYMRENKHLPDFDPRSRWAFFQPPLHHIVSAKVMDISESLGMGEKQVQESTQIPTCIYMIVVMLASITMFLNAKGVSKVFSSNAWGKLCTYGGITLLGIVACHPIFTLLSGSINNDALALVLSILALLVAARWYEKPSYFTTIVLAILIGLAMIAKLTGGLVSVPIGILMVKKIFGFDDKRNHPKHRINLFIKKYLLKMIVFTAVVFPLGLSFTIWNKIKWGMPINYIPAVGENFPDTVTIKDRLTTLKTESVYTHLISRGDSYDEYSVPLAMFKTSLFGEYNFSDVSRWMKPLTIIVFLAALILLLISLYATVYVTMSKRIKVSDKWKILLFGTWATYLAAYLYFAISHGNFSAQDFRYSAICIVCEGVFAGIFVDEMKSQWIKKAISALAVIFAGSSFLVYALLGFKS